MKKILFFVLGVMPIYMMSGCAYVGNGLESDNSLATKAAFALNTTSNKVTISQREPTLDAINFIATVDNKSYQCYVTTLFGALTSDAICSGSSSIILDEQKRPCNALLKAAGQCKE
ncbi:MAG: hypothetical protein RBS91_02625 [Sulfurimonadaceae bacterium]|jgi:hypothetical protein|nr:hypothetical protein [Sulfurimonadaceae bacterium]